MLNVQAERVGLVLQRRGDPRGDERHIPRRAVRRGLGRVGDIARAAGGVVVLRLGRLALDRGGRCGIFTSSSSTRRFITSSGVSSARLVSDCDAPPQSQEGDPICWGRLPSWGYARYREF